MTDTSVPATTPTRARRTRVPTWMTDVVLVITLVFGIWAMALIFLTAYGITQSQEAGLGFKAALKAVGSTVVVVLALSQAYTMHAVMGHLPRGQVKMGTLMRAHRFGGRTAISLAALIAIFCLVDIGAPSQPLRVATHAISGATAFTALGIKFSLIRFRPTTAYDWAPRLGWIAVVAFIVIWVTSGLAYLTGNL